jgi:hypothetical protein
VFEISVDAINPPSVYPKTIFLGIKIFERVITDKRAVISIFTYQSLIFIKVVEDKEVRNFVERVVCTCERERERMGVGE